MSATLHQLLESARQSLQPFSDSARIDAEVLLCHCLERPRSFLLAHPEYRPTTSERRCLATLLERRRRGAPIAYLTGIREFWTLALEVSPDTLIPRPETERLVELALERIPANEAWQIADLGTGAGPIALALASERPRCDVLATDLSEPALAVARRNAMRLRLDNVRFAAAHWLDAFRARFHLITANPPYIAHHDPHLERGDLRFEPALALAAGPQGMDALEPLIRDARDHLHIGGWLLLEHGYDQKAAVLACLRRAGYSNIADFADPAGNDRVAVGQWPR